MAIKNNVTFPVTAAEKQLNYALTGVFFDPNLAPPSVPFRFTITGPEHPTPGMSEFRTDVSAYAPLTIAWQITPQTGVLAISPVGNGNICSVQFSQASVNINYSVTATASNRHGTTKAYYNFVMNPGESSWLRKTTPEETDSEETNTE